MVVKKNNILILVIVLSVLASGLIIDIPIVTPIVKPIKPLVVGFGRGIWGLIEETRPTPTIQPDVPTRTQDEACALIYDYLENKVSSMSAVPYRINLLNTLGKARPDFQAVYQDNGKWQVSAIGYGVQINLEEYKKNFTPDEIQEIEAVSAAEREQWVKSHEQGFLEQHFPSNPSWVKTGVHRMYYYRGGLWSVYETSGVIEPANEQASELLLYIQWFIR